MSDPRADGSPARCDDARINRMLETLEQFTPERIQQVWDAPSVVDLCGDDALLSLEAPAEDRRVAEGYARYYLMPLFDPPSDLPPPVDPGIAETLSAEFCRRHRIAPLADDGQTLEVAIDAPESLLLADQIRRLTGRQMQPMFAPASVIERLLDLLYGEAEGLLYRETEGLLYGDAETREPDPRDLPDRRDLGSGEPAWPPLGDASGPDDHAAGNRDAGASPDSAGPPQESHGDEPAAPWDPLPLVPFDGDDAEAGEAIDWLDPTSEGNRESQAVQYVQHLIEQTLQVGADGIHLEPAGQRCRVRLRIGGALRETSPPPAPLFGAVVERIKTLAGIEVDRRDWPAQGTIHVRSGDQRFRLKVSSCPTIDGEKLVLGVGTEIDPRSSLSDLGFEVEQRRDLAAAVAEPGGWILVVGPSGGGKTTTLYAALNQYNGGDRSICTAEQRVHAQLPGIQQVAASGIAGARLHEILPPLLHQDPDLLMVDEIDGAATAELCLRAAVTGPLVIAGLHAGDALTGLQRARQLTGGSLLLGRSLRLIVAQRLLRRLCGACRTPWEVDRGACRRYGLTAGMVLYRAGRCADCRYTGYRGRLPVLETLTIDAPLAEQISAGDSLQAIEQTLHRRGHQALAQRALSQAMLGETSLEEVAPLWRSC